VIASTLTDEFEVGDTVLRTCRTTTDKVAEVVALCDKRIINACREYAIEDDLIYVLFFMAGITKIRQFAKCLDAAPTPQDGAVIHIIAATSKGFVFPKDETMRRTLVRNMVTAVEMAADWLAYNTDLELTLDKQRIKEPNTKIDHPEDDWKRCLRKYRKLHPDNAIETYHYLCAKDQATIVRDIEKGEFKVDYILHMRSEWDATRTNHKAKRHTAIFDKKGLLTVDEEVARLNFKDKNDFWAHVRRYWTTHAIYAEANDKSYDREYTDYTSKGRWMTTRTMNTLIDWMKLLDQKHTFSLGQLIRLDYQVRLKIKTGMQEADISGIEYPDDIQYKMSYLHSVGTDLQADKNTADSKAQLKKLAEHLAPTATQSSKNKKRVRFNDEGHERGYDNSQKVPKGTPHSLKYLQGGN
jgi:hypothetical protein